MKGMKVLFISSGNSKHHVVSPFIKSQGDSLQKKNVEVTYFTVDGKGAKNYLKSVGKLKRLLKEQSFDLIHAHYSLCGWVAVLGAGKTPVVLSLMGDDAQGTFTGKGKIEFKSRIPILLTKMIQPFVHAIISKSWNLEKAVYRKKISHLVPNGVRLEQFKIYENGCREELDLDPNKKYVLFLANPKDPNKNIALVRAAVEQLNRKDVELLNIYGVPHNIVVKYLNSVDVFTLCSFGEGSPNVVKEAMACNCPLVVTNVGDTVEVIGKMPGGFIGGFEPADFAEKLSHALAFAARYKRTKGRVRLLELGLDADSIADRLIKIYQKVLGIKTNSLETKSKEASLPTIEAGQES